MPTLEEFVNKKNIPERKVVFGLTSEFDKDPQKYCPECNSVRIQNVTPRHSIDYTAYQCKNCNLHYELDYD
ncbi:MAG: hypothetical protein AABY26_06890 [Nanoarchaeota archaeon]